LREELPVPNKFRLRPLSLAACLGLGALAGCHQPDIAREHLFRPDRWAPVSWDGGELRAGTPLAFDVRNDRGSVWIEVDEKLEAPVVVARVSWDGKERTKTWPGDTAGAAVYAARDTTQAAGDVVRISSTLNEGAPESAFVDVRVRTPRCDGVTVLNDGGPIVLVGVGGAITARNGEQGGRIEVRTSRPLTDPVALVTARGKVSAVIGPGGSGLIELDSESGSAEFESEFGSVTEVRPSLGRFRGVWNSGANPVIARSGDGDVHVQVQRNAEMYSVSDDWLALFKD